MEQKINVAELLKDYPSGMELDSTIMENVYFDEVLNNSIKCFYIQNRTKIRSTVYFNKFGEYFGIENGKCVIFPKGKTTWEGFHRPFKDGDILYIDCNNHGDTNKKYQYIFILKEINEGAVYCYCYISNDKANTHKNFEKCCLADMRDNLCFATEEEKQKLFDAIKANGYKWNPDTKTLEKLPKFKVGDEIVKRNSITNSWIVNSVSSEYYGLKLPNGFEGIGVLPVSEQDDCELISNKLERSVEPKFKVGDVIQDEDAYKVTITEVNVEDKLYEYESTIAKGIGGIAFSEQDNWELVPNKFDINTLKPFDKVLVRDFDNGIWEIDFFSRLLDGKYFKCLDLSYIQCIPYESNEHLLGTSNDCNDYYKTWK